MARYCKCCSIAALSDYANNPVFQELPTRSKYFTSVGGKIYIDLRRRKGYLNEIEKLNRDDSDLTITIQLKVSAEKKMRLRNWLLPGRVLILDDKGGDHYELQKVRSKQKHAIS